MKWYSTFPKAPALREPHHEIVLCHIRALFGEEMQSAYSIAPIDWMGFHFDRKKQVRKLEGIKKKKVKNKTKKRKRIR